MQLKIIFSEESHAANSKYDDLRGFLSLEKKCSKKVELSKGRIPQKLKERGSIKLETPTFMPLEKQSKNPELLFSQKQLEKTSFKPTNTQNQDVLRGSHPSRTQMVLYVKTLSRNVKPLSQQCILSHLL